MMKANKYHKWYNELIERARNRVIEGYVERHHVVPKCLGGTNEPGNLVDLTAREHLIAHMLLPRFTSGGWKLWQALYCMMTMGEVKVTGRLYEQARINTMTQRSRDPVWRAKIKAAAAARLQDPIRRKEMVDKLHSSFFKQLKDPNSQWRKNRKLAARRINKQLAQTPHWVENHTKALRESAQKPLTRANRALGRITSGTCLRFPNRAMEREGLFEVIKNDDGSARADIALALLSA